MNKYLIEIVLQNESIDYRNSDSQGICLTIVEEANSGDEADKNLTDKLNLVLDEEWLFYIEETKPLDSGG